ncbi:MAG: bifunctional UDP-N-acetylglucosamine diphosphorylase/glucosamine-1-phosphate N-acetyltransferase GlmU [Fimbriimonadaceae bacterium]|nr:bifunctional UDP-N-acetylglucosamine diphosphorylase/glucosamine-1-phosphate N-acetyltransferase GlmU [Chthonomonadaceae bacterium]MCO5297150.1 bifunctional UDP-N-acetylglucosamine diphosphorylase/glucosamine-1-phosphate N-acetyltransferase GlmU [Fimbriimonadaceae bacterium]
MKVAGIILAAGKGTRMKSDLPKGLFAACGVPMVELIGRAMRGAGIDRPVVITGHRGELLREAFGDRYEYAVQEQQMGTGHAAMMARDVLAHHVGPVVVTPGDTPLLTAEALNGLIETHLREGAECTMATVTFEDPTGYGRVLRDSDGVACQIVEEKDATPEQRRLKEVCVSVYCFSGPTLFRLLPTLSTDNAQGEYYLTDMIGAVYKDGGRVATHAFEEAETMLGVNDRWQLAQASAILRSRILRKHALNGVTIVDPTNTYIGFDVEIGTDTTIQPMTNIEGSTVIGEGCEIGPNTRVEDSTIGRGCTVLMSHLARAVLKDRARCGPYANLRPGAVLGEDVKVGNFVEIKNATLGPKSSVSHLTYIGDAEVGARTNVGAGTITCNYDGFAKHRTVIGEDAFIGSNTTLIAPLKIGDGAFVAAGSVINKEVPANALAVGRSRQEVREEWAAHWREKKAKNT